MASPTFQSPPDGHVITRPAPLPTTAPPAPVAEQAARLMSLDAYRGFVMLAMASGGFAFARVSRTFDVAKPDGLLADYFDRVRGFLAYQFDHVPWVGCAFWDLIQPSFMFMVGVALPFSFAARQAKGHSPLRNALHVVYRSVVLILLGIFLVSNGMKHTNITFVNVLTQIGLGYAFVYLLLGRGWKVQFGTATLILVGYWLLFALYPAPPADFDYAAVGVKDASIVMSDFFAHWNKNANVASRFDQWFINLFRPAEPFRFSEGGYATLNFVPSMATMIFGLMAGEWVRGRRAPCQKLLGLLAAGAVFLGAGWLLGQTVCPLVKRIWTPSWTVFSTGWTLLLLGGFYGLIDVVGWRRWAFPFVVVGMNSIAMYCMAQLLKGWIAGSFKTHFGPGVFGGWYAPIVESVVVLGVLWLVCLWLYRRKVFIRI